MVNNRLLYRLIIIISIIVVVSLIVASYIWYLYLPVHHQKTPETTGLKGMTKVIVTINAEGELLHYKNQSFWSEDVFNKMLSSKDEYTSTIINSFKEDVEPYGLTVIDPEVVFDEEDDSVALVCDIKGAMYASNSYNFQWLVQKLPVDLYGFNQSRYKLVYESELNGVSVEITLIFPFVLEHCHAHVWPANP